MLLRGSAAGLKVGLRNPATAVAAPAAAAAVGRHLCDVDWGSMAQQRGLEGGGASRGSTGQGGWRAGLQAKRLAAWPVACEGGSRSSKQEQHPRAPCGQRSYGLCAPLFYFGSSSAGVAIKPAQQLAARHCPTVWQGSAFVQTHSSSASAAALWQRHAGLTAQPVRPGSGACWPAASTGPLLAAPLFLLPLHRPRLGTKEPNS
jgi:hypothetical protein